jgi:hypothetical protein
MVGCTVGQASRRTHRRVVRSRSRGQSGALGKPASALHACRVRRPSWDYSDGLLGGCGQHNGEHNAPARQFVISDSAAARRSRATRPLPPKNSSGCSSAASSAMNKTRRCLGVRSASRRASGRGTGAHNGGCVDLRIRLVRSCVLSSAISFHNWFPYLVVRADLSCIIAMFGSIISFHNERRI